MFFQNFYHLSTGVFIADKDIKVVTIKTRFSHHPSIPLGLKLRGRYFYLIP